jgi:hypothetical protein
MSEEVIQNDVQTEAPVSAPVDTAAPQSAPAQSAPDFDTPFGAFRHLPEFAGQDDLAIAQNLYRAFNGYGETQRQLQQYQQVVPYAQEYLKNQRDFEAWKKSQAEAAQPKPQAAPKWWAPPEVKDTWKSYIVRDPQTGKEIISPDAPYEAQAALREYQTYTADFARKLVTDPENTLKPFVEQVAIQKAQEMVQQHLNQYQAQNYVSDLERQNADWLYDQQGNISREGQAIQGYIAQAAEIGIQDPKARWQYATGMLQRDLLNLRYQQMQAHAAQGPAGVPAPVPAAPPQPADPVAESNMQFLRERATRAPNRSAGTTEPRAPRARMSFEERLKSQLVSDGVI